MAESPTGTLNYDQFSDAGPSPTHEDAMATVVHLADSSAFNHKHAAMHMKRVQDELKKMPGAQAKIVVWNMDHAIKHFISAQGDTESLVRHVRSHPAFQNPVQETGAMTNMLQGWNG